MSTVIVVGEWIHASIITRSTCYKESTVACPIPEIDGSSVDHSLSYSPYIRWLAFVLIRVVARADRASHHKLVPSFGGWRCTTNSAVL
jgi:hypothetical protein